MSVQQQLGLEVDSLLMQQIEERWPLWEAREERLARAGGFSELRAWLRTGDVLEVDDALHALARLAARDGGDDVIAGAALAWVLLPGAATLAARLADLTQQVDELVAAQLWIEVRSFPWQRRRRVAANVLMATRAGVLLDLGRRLQVSRKDRTWANTFLLKGDSLESCGGLYGELADTLIEDPESDPPAGLDPEQEVADLLDWGVREGVIGEDDRRVLVELVEEAAAAGSGTRVRTVNGGLGGREVSRTVGTRLGVSPATVRRRLHTSVAALSAASSRYVA